MAGPPKRREARETPSFPLSMGLVVTEGSVGFPQLKLGQYKSSVSWKAFMYVGHIELTELSAI